MPRGSFRRRQARIFGVDVWADPVAAGRLVGVLPDGLALPERLTGRELLTVMALVEQLCERVCSTRGAATSPPEPAVALPRWRSVARNTLGTVGIVLVLPQGLVPIVFNLFGVDPEVRVWFAARYLPPRASSSWPRPGSSPPAARHLGSRSRRPPGQG